MPKIIGLFFSVFLCTLSVTPASAFEMRTGETITVDTSEYIDGSIVVAGNTVFIDGEIQGDVYCAGRTVKVTGIVHGDVLCAGETVDITATIDGNVRAAGKTVSISGDVARNANLAGQVLFTTQQSKVNGEVVALGESITLAGDAQKDVFTRGKTVSLIGTVGGSLDAKGESLLIGGTAQVDGETKFVGNQPAQISDTASLSGGFVQEQREKSDHRKDTNTGRTLSGMIWRAIVGTTSTALIGWLAWKFFPGFITRSQQLVASSVGSSALWGLLFLIVGPVIVFFIFITIVGIPLALTLLFAWILVLMLSHLPVAFALGQRVLTYNKRKSSGKLVELIAGALLLAALGVVPFVGWIIRSVACIVGTGAILRALLSSKTK